MSKLRCKSVKGSKGFLINERRMEQTNDVSVFQIKYNEFIEDLLATFPEYTAQIVAAKGLSTEDRLHRFQKEVTVINPKESSSESLDFSKNPGTILPGVTLSDSVWNSLSDKSRQAIGEHIRVLSICCFMEIGFGEGDKPEWMDDIMKDMHKKLEGVDFEGFFKKFMSFLKPGDNTTDGTSEGDTAGAFPKIPERFLKGHLAKLAEELVRDIKPEDLGMSPELIEECEKSPSRAFDILIQVFSTNPGIIQSTVQKIGKRLQQKVQSGAIRPQEIAREAEELMKEFTSNSAFSELLGSLKGTFGFEDPDFARAAGREGSARLSAVRQRLQKKLEKKNQAKTGSASGKK